MRAVTLLLAWALAATAQSIPPSYLDLYTSLQGKLTAFDVTLSGQWDGSKPPMEFCVEILHAHADRGLALLGQNALAGTEGEIVNLQALGATAVSMGIDFPILYKPFFAYNGDPNDFENVLAYYRQVAAAVRALGLRLVVHTGAMDTGDFAAGSGMKVAGYYATMNYSTYVSARAEQIVTIAQYIQPDSLLLADVPDKEAALTGQPAIGTSAGYSSMVDTFLSKLDAAGFTGAYAGAGVGTWLDGASDFVAALAAKPRLNFINLDVGTINADLLDTDVALIDQAAASGKPFSIGASWLEKRADSEYPASKIGWDSNINARNVYSFWAPLDQLFLTELVHLAWWKHAASVAVFWSYYFDAYLTYSYTYDGMAYNQVMDDLYAAAGDAMQANQFTSTGLAWESLVAAPAEMPAMVSAATGLGGAVAPDSIVSVYGTNLGSPLMFSQGQGEPIAAYLYFDSPGQVNGVVPPEMTEGPATFEIGGQSGLVTVAAVAPGLFGANNNGHGPAMAYVSRAKSDGTTDVEPTFTCGTAAGSCANAPIDVSAASGKVTLELFGTGIRGRASLSDVWVSVGGVLVAVSYAGAQPQYPGMDQVNVALPATLAGRGEVNIGLMVAGVWANVVTVSVK